VHRFVLDDDDVLNLPDLHRANIPRAILAEANLSGARVDGANLSGAHLEGVDLRSSTVSQIQLDRACGTEAKLGPGLTLKPCSPSV